MNCKKLPRKIGMFKENACMRYAARVGLTVMGTWRDKLVIPAAEPLSSGRTTPMMKELRKGLSMYAKKERATVKPAARVKVGENGTIIFSSDAAPWEKAMVRTTPMWRAMNGPARNDNAAKK